MTLLTYCFSICLGNLREKEQALQSESVESKVLTAMTAKISMSWDVLSS
jgi:hypothetical protein